MSLPASWDLNQISLDTKRLASSHDILGFLGFSSPSSFQPFEPSLCLSQPIGTLTKLVLTQKHLLWSMTFQTAYSIYLRIQELYGSPQQLFTHTYNTAFEDFQVQVLSSPLNLSLCPSQPTGTSTKLVSTQQDLLWAMTFQSTKSKNPFWSFSLYLVYYPSF